MASKRQRRQSNGARRKPKANKRLPTATAQRTRIGLVADPNADLAPKRQKLTITSVEWVAAEPAPPKNRPLSDFDAEYITKLTKKYGQDFEKMARDRKLNRDQLTVCKLEKMWRKLNNPDASENGNDE